MIRISKDVFQDMKNKGYIIENYYEKNFVVVNRQKRSSQKTRYICEETYDKYLADEARRKRDKK